MDNKEFDKYIKSRLESIDSKTPPNDWDQFSQILNQEEGFEGVDTSDQEFDKLISDKINKKSVRFNSLHWILLKNRLEKEALLRKNVYTTKIMESMLVLLLVFTFINLDNYYNITPNNARTPQEVALLEALKYPEFSRLPALNKTKINQVVKSPANNASNSKQNIEQPQASMYNNQEANGKIGIEFTPLNIIKLNTIFYNSPKDKESYNNIISTFVDPHDDESTVDQAHNRDRIEDINRLKSQQEEVKYDLEEAYPMFYIKPKDKQTKDLYLTASIGSVFGVVNSPGDARLDLDPYSIYNIDFATGIEVSTIFKNFEIGMGLNYQNVSYSPAKIKEISGGFQSPLVENTLEKIQFDLFQVPMSFRYHFRPSARTHFFAGLGVNMNIAGFTSYKISSEELAPPSAPFEQNRPENSARFLEDKNFHPGALESGTIFDNFYLSAGAEIGLETRIEDNFSITASLGYSKTLSYLGLGPNNDIIDAVKFGIGMKYKI